MKQITGVYTAPAQHWVGDGFPGSLDVFLSDARPAAEPSYCSTSAGPYTFPAGSENAASVSIRIADLKPSPSSTPVK